MLTVLDWTIITLYMIFMVALSIFLGRSQKNQKDYYLGGNDLNTWSVALSTMATQCSTNSLLGAPAFVAFSLGGGLIWLQYEMAVPLAMIAVLYIILPIFRNLGLISVYSYLESRFDYKTRASVSLFFQVFRALANGVTVYGVSLVLMICLDIPFWVAALGLGAVTIVYDMIGGMKAVVYSDVIQMVILVISIFLAIFFAIDLMGWETFIENIPKDRVRAINFKDHGLGDGQDFAFWPMVIGGAFLYIAYYGTDQSQVQRELSTRSIDETNKSLFLNGLLRFPLVASYCFLGICLASFAAHSPNFISTLPLMESGEPNYNLSLPMFVLEYFPAGLVGLVVVGLFAAAMSSLDSVINSLSAVTMRDFVQRLWFPTMTNKQEVLWSRLLTLFWGCFCVGFAFMVESVADSVIVAVNKIGSVANGPILGVFLLGLLTRMANGTGAIVGLLSGLMFNLSLWLFAPQVSWLWWNFFGFVVTFATGLFLSAIFPSDKVIIRDLVWEKGALKRLGCQVNWFNRSLLLAGYFVLIVIACYGITTLSVETL